MDIRNVIMGEIEKIGSYKPDNDGVFIHCPFRNERDPSCHINTGEKVPFGTFHCFGCGKSGSWNILAEKLGLKQVEFKSGNIQSDNPFLYLNKQLQIETEYTPPNGLLAWKSSWRGFKYSFLRRFNPARILDSITQERRMLLFVKVGDDILGHVSCSPNRYAKHKYMFSSGHWVRYALFPYNYVDGTTVILVEGVRDALRLISRGMHALCIFGANNWSRYKVLLLQSKGIDNVILLMDGDNPGLIASRKIYKSIHRHFNVVVIDLPILPNPSQIDPCNMPSKCMGIVKKVYDNPKEFPRKVEVPLKIILKTNHHSLM